MCDAHILLSILDIRAANEDEKIIDVPTQPKYKIGGCIANAGSWRIGFNPFPSFGTGNKFENGFEVKRIKSKNPKI